MAIALHPYLLSAEEPFLRLCRAHYWSVQDLDHTHAEYWRAQVAECERLYLAQFLPDSCPAEVRERRAKLAADQCGVALREGYAAASTGGVHVPFDHAAD